MIRILATPAGNASSIHAYGHGARMVVESAREEVARLIGARPEEVVLTGGGTEANNLAIFGAVPGDPSQGRRVVTSAFEHPSVLEVVGELEERGTEVVRVSPGRTGVVPAAAILKEAVPGTFLVSLMLANNELGTLQPVAAVGRELPQGCPPALRRGPRGRQGRGRRGRSVGRSAVDRRAQVR